MAGQSEIEGLKQLFSQADFDQDGYLTSEELQGALNTFRPDITFKQADLLLRLADNYRRGKINSDEFVELIKNYNGYYETENEIRDLFNLYDTNRTGFLDRKALKEIVEIIEDRELSDKDVDEIINKYDIDKDGKLNLAEFKAGMADE